MKATPNLKRRFLQKFKVGSPKDCWPWIGAKTVKGYGKILGMRAGQHLKAHRVSVAVFRGECPDDLVVCHSCDNPICVNPGHLFLGTQADNCADMYRKGRAYDKSGAANPRAKFTPQQVVAIRDDGRNQYVIAAEYGVSQSTIGRIKRDEVYSERQ